MNEQQRRQRTDDLFNAALQLSDEDRDAFLNEKCHNDPELRKRVAALLREFRTTPSREGTPALSNMADLDTGFFTDDMSTTMNPPRERGGAADRAYPARKTLPFFQGFDILEEIGRGGMGVVYRALDRGRGHVVALKTMRYADYALLARFKKEFRALASFSHPNLAKLYQLVVDERQRFFTMEYVKGCDFLSYVGSGARAGIRTEAQEHRLRESLRQLCEGVVALHAAGKVHRDIKPSNVLVTDSGRVVLVDFGLAIDLSQEGDSEGYQTVSGPLVGTPGFMSPEQAAGDPVTPASDWYSVGVLLYQALSGRLPFEGTLSQILRDQQREDPPPLAVPTPLTDLADFCVTLLSRRPERRPAAIDVLKRIGKSVAVESSYKAKSPFVGREEQLQRLLLGYQGLRRRQAAALLIRGESGTGKSALVSRFLKQIHDDPDLLVLSARCYKQEAVPYKAVDDLVDRLTRYLRTLSDEQADALLPRDIVALARVFPTLRQVDAVKRAFSQESSCSDPQELRWRAFAAFRELLTRIGDRKRLVLAVDDLQWGDRDSAALLSFVLRQPDRPVILLVGSFRSEDLQASPSLSTLVDSLQDANHISLDPLTEEQSRRLAQSLTAELPPDARQDGLVHRIASESRGNPFFLQELARSFVRGNLSERNQNNPTLEDMLWSRIQRLPQHMRTLLYLLSVAGQPLQQATLSAASQLEASQFSPALATLCHERLIRYCGHEQEALIDTYHDRVRDAIVSRLGEEQSNCHLRLANTGEALPQPDAEFLAMHFRLAHAPQKAAVYYLRAGDQVLQKLAFHKAAEFYAEALRLHELPFSEQNNVRVRMAVALASAGRGVEAAQEYLDLADSHEGSERLELRRRAFTLFLFMGHLREAMSILSDVLRELGQRLPASPRKAVTSLLWARLRLWTKRIEPRLTFPDDASDADLVRVDILWSVATGMSIIDNLQGAVFASRHLLEALRVGETSRHARALALESGFLAAHGRLMRSRSKKLIRAAKKIAGPLKDPLLTAHIDSCEGIGSGLLGEWSACYSCCRQAEIGFEANRSIDVNLSRKAIASSIVDHTAVTRFWQMLALTWLGNLTELQRRFSVLMESARERRNLYEQVILGTYIMSIVRLAQDKPDEARHDLAFVVRLWHYDGFHIQHHGEVLAETSILLYQGNYSDAHAALRESWPKHKRSLLLGAHLVRAHCQHLRARIAIMAAAEGPTRRRAWIREAQRALRALTRERRDWTAALAAAGRGSLATIVGDSDRAVREFNRAATSFESLGMGLYAAVARRRLGQILGGQHGQQLVETADEWMTDQEILAPAKFAALLIPGIRD